MDLALARRLYGEAMAEADAEKAADITRAYNRVTRSLRQSIALRARLAQGWENHHVNHGRRVDLTAESPTLSYLGLAAGGLAGWRSQAGPIRRRQGPRLTGAARSCSGRSSGSSGTSVRPSVSTGPRPPAFGTASPMRRWPPSPIRPWPAGRWSGWSATSADATACATIPTGKACPSRWKAGSSPRWNSPTTGEALQPFSTGSTRKCRPSRSSISTTQTSGSMRTARSI